jgi:hypothetical protein
MSLKLTQSVALVYLYGTNERIFTFSGTRSGCDPVRCRLHPALLSLDFRIGRHWSPRVSSRGFCHPMPAFVGVLLATPEGLSAMAEGPSELEDG